MCQKKLIRLGTFHLLQNRKDTFFPTARLRQIYLRIIPLRFNDLAFDTKNLYIITYRVDKLKITFESILFCSRRYTTLLDIVICQNIAYEQLQCDFTRQTFHSLHIILVRNLFCYDYFNENLQWSIL